MKQGVSSLDDRLEPGEREVGSRPRKTVGVSVVVCVRNEEARIEDCLRSIVANQCEEIIVVDGGSVDGTVEIAERYATRIVRSGASNITRDRQLGVDAARNQYIAMIDADHRLRQGDIDSLLADLDKYKLDIVQSQLISHDPSNFWTRAEEEAWYLVHNRPGPRKMIGTAPAIFRKSVFQKVRFDDHITTRIDDSDFVYRLSKYPEIRIGIGDTQIRQLHFGSLRIFLHKFVWYGIGDGQFCRKHPTRACSMIFHLLVRYPVLYSLRSIVRNRWRAPAYFVMQGLVRFYGLVLCLVGMRS